MVGRLVCAKKMLSRKEVEKLLAIYPPTAECLILYLVFLVLIEYGVQSLMVYCVFFGFFECCDANSERSLCVVKLGSA